MRRVDQHPDLVHRLDDRFAEVADSAVDAVGRARSDQVLAVVGELGAAQAEAVEVLDVVGRLELVGVLQAHDDRGLALGLGAVEVGGGPDQREVLGLAPDPALIGGEESRACCLARGPPMPIA